MRILSISTAALLTLSPATPAIAGTPTPPTCIAGTSQSFSATGALQTYSVPAGATALLITANGGSGGSVIAESGFFVPGGRCAFIVAGVPVSGLTTLDVVVGSAGRLRDHRPGGDEPGTSGGGGGSFVFTPGGTLLVAAGA